ncbi:MAG: hypothetical protein FWE37_02450 [Spirochaetaceae bacterium]|nr:hypothetical protein [Spirochaetaceae bacterium]
MVKKTWHKNYKPTKVWGYCLTDTILQENTLTILGYEYPPNATEHTDNNFGWPFERVIDTNFYSF